MKPAALVIILLVCSTIQAQQKFGSICVAPNSSERPRIISPGGDYNPATLFVKIDQKEAIPWPHEKPVSVTELTLKEFHLVVLTSDGKRIQSFHFRFSEYPSSELCMSFDGYQGVQLYDKGTDRRRAKYCGCTCQ
jgi:hypothetical protein